jgi:hypothetical protein
LPDDGDFVAVVEGFVGYEEGEVVGLVGVGVLVLWELWGGWGLVMGMGDKRGEKRTQVH